MESLTYEEIFEFLELNKYNLDWIENHWKFVENQIEEVKRDYNPKSVRIAIQLMKHV